MFTLGLWAAGAVLFVCHMVRNAVCWMRCEPLQHDPLEEL